PLTYTLFPYTTLFRSLQTLPDLVFGLFAGAIADRSNQKRMMVIAHLGRAVLTALIPLSVVLHGPTMAVILIVAAPMSTLRSLFLDRKSTRLNSSHSQI